MKNSKSNTTIPAATSLFKTSHYDMPINVGKEKWDHKCVLKSNVN